MTTNSHPIEIDAEQNSRRESIEIREPLLYKWRNVARDNKRLHEASRAYYKSLADTSIITAVVLGSTGSLLNILLGVIPNSTAMPSSVVNVGQVVLGAAGLVSAGIVSIATQLGWTQKNQLHEEYTSRYSEVVRMINSEETLFRLNDSTYASRGDFIRHIQAELNRIEDHAPPVPASIQDMLKLKSAQRNGD